MARSIPVPRGCPGPGPVPAGAGGASAGGAAELWLGVNGRGPLTLAGISQLVVRRGEQAGMAVHPQRFRHHFSHT
jgi:hypothetical protein